MSKTIKTIQYTDKKAFDDTVNTLLEAGCGLLEDSYEVIKDDGGVNIYSQVVVYDGNKYVTLLNDNGQIHYFACLNKDGEVDGKWTNWHDNGQKLGEGTYKDGEKDGRWNYWYDNGQKKKEKTYKDGERIGKWTYYKKDGLVKEVKNFKPNKKGWDLRNEDEKSIDIKKIKHPFQPDWVKTDKDVELFLELLDKNKPDNVDEKDWYPPFIYGVKINDEGEEQLYSIFSKWNGDYDPVQVGKPAPNIIPLKMTD